MIIACLAVRLKSSRLPKKALLKISGKELFLHTYERAKCSKRVDKVIVCTSDNQQDSEIVRLCEQNNIDYYAGDEKDVMNRFIDSVKDLNPDHIVRITGDNPCISYEFIDQAINHHVNTNSMYTTTEDLPRGMRSEIIDFKFLKNLHMRLVDPSMTEYMTWYLDRPDKWKVSKIKADQQLQRREYRVTVDTREDYDSVKMIYDKLYKGKPISSYEIVKAIDEDDTIRMVNDNIKQRSYSDLKSKVDIRTIDEAEAQKL